MKIFMILLISCLVLANCKLQQDQIVDINEIDRKPYVGNEVADLTDPIMSQCLTESTGYKNIDELMENLYQEFLVANNLTVLAKETMPSLIGYQKTLQSTSRTRIRYCCRRRKFGGWLVCVQWCFTESLGWAK